MDAASLPYPFIILCVYLGALVILGIISVIVSRHTAEDYFVASHSLGPVLMLLSTFSTVMTSFALIGSTGEAYSTGIGVYGMMASWSGIVHAGVFFLVGIRLWGFGRKYGYITQIQYFRDRFESNAIGVVLFPILVALVIPYVLMGLMSAGTLSNGATGGTFKELFKAVDPANVGFFESTNGGIPPGIASAVITAVVLFYIFAGGFRGAAWANALQTVLFMAGAFLTYISIAHGLGGFSEASQAVLEAHPEKLVRGEEITQLHFLSYAFVPLSVGMFPHLFQQWLTAKSAKTFRLTVIAHPIFIMLLWLPCVMIGVWATSAMLDGKPVIPPGTLDNAVLPIMIKKLVNPFLAGLISVGIMSAIISFDSQFFALGTMFTNDIVIHHFGKDRFSDKQKIMLARIFIVVIVILTFLLSLKEPRSVFKLGIWCFSGFAGLFPIVFASIYWKRVTKAGVFASIAAVASCWLILFKQGKYGADSDYLFLGMEPAGPVFFVGLIALVVVSLFTKPPSEATLKKFFAN